MASGESETRKRIVETAWRLLVDQRGKAARMSDIAAVAGVSRQAVYLHFASRADLLIAATRHGDEVLGLEGRLRPYREATGGVAKLEAFVTFWGQYIPEIYGLARALLTARETDAAAAAAWDDRMAAVRDGCRTVIEALQRDDVLAPHWSRDEAIDLLWTLLSIRNWEALTIDCGWSREQYTERMQVLARRALVYESKCQTP
jgi:AcrR family transcriptional regulator